MAARFRHFAINADDVQRAREFYEKVFQWKFSPWGPPNFYQVKDAGAGLMGALQERRGFDENKRTTTFEPTFEVDDLRATMAGITSAGGRIVMQPMRIEGVGELIYFVDTEGNLVGVMQYDEGVWQ